MKNIKVKFLFQLIMLLFLSAGIVQAQSITGSKNVITQNRSISGFQSINVSRGLDVYITQGEAEKVMVEADDNLMNIIRTEVKGSTLNIYAEKNINRAQSQKVFVTVKSLEMIKTSSGSDVYAEDGLTADEMAIEASGGSDIRLKLKANVLLCKVSGGADAEITGTVNEMEAVASGGADIKASELETKKAILTASGGSDIYIHVLEALDAVAKGGSDIHYTGNPKVINRDISMSSDLHSN